MKKAVRSKSVDVNEEFEAMEPHYEPILKIHFPLKFPDIDSFATQDASCFINIKYVLFRCPKRP